MKRALFVVVGLILATIGVSCAWDRDTLAVELEGMPGVADVVAGRIDRNPDLYYEMRIERVLKEVEEDPLRLDLYDDLGVAYDRLGDHDSAIDWMLRKGRKLAVMDMDEAGWKDAEYKRLANLGTFRVHKWFSDGADREDVSLLEDGLKDLLQALEINPDAHFGREVVQVVMVQAILEPEKTEGLFAPKLILDDEVERFREGILGIMVLGEAWQSVDAFRLLSVFSGRGYGAAQHLVLAKVADLKSQGKEEILDFSQLVVIHPPEVIGDGDVEKAYAALIENGQEYRNNRELFMMSKLRAGKHPDTDEDFWEGYEEVPEVDVRELLGYGPSAEERREEWNSKMTVATIMVFSVIVALGVAGYLMTRRRAGA